MSDQEFEKITPADISLNAGKKAEARKAPDETSQPEIVGMDDIRKAEQYQQKNHRILVGIFAVLLVLVAGVFFILPEYIAPAAPELSRVIPTAPTPQRMEPEVSPFAEAQIMAQRDDAQEILAELLELQDSLQEQGVETWAAEAYAAALAQAADGDSFYQQQQYIDAQQNYQASLLALQTIEQSMPQVLAGYIEQGFDAIDNGNAAAAESAFSSALLIEPGNSSASRGLARAATLNDVMALLEQGQEAQQVGDLEAALQLFEQAVSIDRDHNEAQELVLATNQAILDRDFSEAMSRGFAMLQTNPREAENAFNSALALKPESTEAMTALQQAQDRITFIAVSEQLEIADEYVSQEQWTEALAAFEQALALDPNVVAALEGRNYSQSRSNLDNFLEATIADPLRLADEGVYRQTREVFNQAQQISSPGPRLQAQLAQIESFLRAAIQEVTVQLHSDGLTRVSVYRIAELGQFNATSLLLTPGNYIAVGVREGYRDVREEFTVSIEGEAPLVDIRCTERI